MQYILSALIDEANLAKATAAITTFATTGSVTVKVRANGTAIPASKPATPPAKPTPTPRVTLDGRVRALEQRIKLNPGRSSKQQRNASKREARGALTDTVLRFIGEGAKRTSDIRTEIGDVMVAAGYRKELSKAVYSLLKSLGAKGLVDGRPVADESERMPTGIMPCEWTLTHEGLERITTP